MDTPQLNLHSGLLLVFIRTFLGQNRFKLIENYICKLRTIHIASFFFILVQINFGFNELYSQQAFNQTYVLSSNTANWNGVIYAENGASPCNCYLSYGDINNQAAVMAVDRDGTFMWANVYGPDGSTFLDAALRTTNRIGFVGTVSTAGVNDIIVTEVLESGNALWTRRFSGITDINSNHATRVVVPKIANRETLGYWIAFNSDYSIPGTGGDDRMSLIYIDAHGTVLSGRDISHNNFNVDTQMRDILYDKVNGNLIIHFNEAEFGYYALTTLSNDGLTVSLANTIAVQQNNSTLDLNTLRIDGNKVGSSFNFYLSGQEKTNGHGILIGYSQNAFWAKMLDTPNTGFTGITVSNNSVIPFTSEANAIRWITFNADPNVMAATGTHRSNNGGNGGFVTGPVLGGMLSGGPFSNVDYFNNPSSLDLEIARLDEVDLLCDYEPDRLQLVPLTIDTSSQVLKNDSLQFTVDNTTSTLKFALLRSEDSCANCQTNLDLHENPQPDLVNKASFYIDSDDIVDYSLSSIYRAGDNIDLTKGFEVVLGSVFDADIDECDEECSVSPPCEGTPCAEVDFELDSEGNKYVPNQLTIMKDAGSVPYPGSPDDIRNFISTILYNSTAIQNPPATYEEFRDSTTIEKCLCGFDIYLYEVDPVFQISEEDGGIVINTNTNSVDEGVSASLNHYVDASLTGDEEPLPAGGTIDFASYMLNTNPGLPRVAFLDSGVNPAILPNGCLLDDVRPGYIQSAGCNMTADDQFGWNFINDSKDIWDYRGHGSAVYLSYLASLEKLMIAPSDQNTMIVKVLDDCGIGTTYSTACGLHYAASKGADVINTSWGLYANNYLLQNTIDYITLNGAIVSCSSGNSGLDVSMVEHFPSGYGYPHSHIVDIHQEIFSPSIGIESVFEVSGLCRAVGNNDCLLLNEEVDLWSGSNYRTLHNVFAEPAIEIQTLVNDANPSGPAITCGIMGTSYAAPIFSAGLLSWYRDNSGQTIKKIFMEMNSVTWTTDDGTFSSYLLNNNLSCN